MNQKIDLDAVIRKVPDFPKKGILFYDITSVLAHPPAFQFCIKQMLDLYANVEVDAVAAIEARGFLFAAPFAEKMGLPLLLVRKKGKLPGKTIEKTFSLEYGEDTIEMHVDDLEKITKVLLIDDLIATGGTIRAAADLIKNSGSEVVGIFSVIGLPFLNYEKLLSDIPIKTLINYHGE